jgi:hypothetical protein
MIRTLYLEELKATMRGRFAWLGAAVVLLAVGSLATVGTQDIWLAGYGLIAYFLVPLAFIPFAAGAMASPRANRFVESVFTAPVGRRDWFVAKLLVLLTVALFYYLALLPMMLVYVHHVGVPFLLQRFLFWTPGLLVASVAVGSLIGVLFIGGSVGPPVATAMGVLLAYAGLVPLQELLVSQGNGATRTGHITLLSPAALLKNGLGFTIVAANMPTTTTLTWLSAAVVIFGSTALATWVFLRAQGVETWETSRSQRWTIAATLVVMLLIPIALADTNYDTPRPATSRAPAIRALFARGTSSLALVAPGQDLPRRCCNTILNREAWPFGTDESTSQDLLILLPVDASRPVTDLQVHVFGDAGLNVVADPNPPRLETHTYGTDAGPIASDGHRVVTGWMARVPITLTPTQPWDIGGLRYPLNVSATYRVTGDARPGSLTARGAVDAQVARAIYEMGVAAAILPLFCLGAAITRWRRTR